RSQLIPYTTLFRSPTVATRGKSYKRLLATLTPDSPAVVARHSASSTRFCPRMTTGAHADSPSLEQLIEKPLPFALLVGAHQHGDDLLLGQHRDDPRRV